MNCEAVIINLLPNGYEDVGCFSRGSWCGGMLSKPMLKWWFSVSLGPKYHKLARGFNMFNSSTPSLGSKQTSPQKHPQKTHGFVMLLDFTCDRYFNTKMHNYGGVFLTQRLEDARKRSGRRAWCHRCSQGEWGWDEENLQQVRCIYIYINT